MLEFTTPLSARKRVVLCSHVAALLGQICVLAQAPGVCQQLAAMHGFMHTGVECLRIPVVGFPACSFRSLLLDLC